MLANQHQEKKLVYSVVKGLRLRNLGEVKFLISNQSSPCRSRHMQESTTAIHLCHKWIHSCFKSYAEVLNASLVKKLSMQVAHSGLSAPTQCHEKPSKYFEYLTQIAFPFIEHWNIMLICRSHGKGILTCLDYPILCWYPIRAMACSQASCFWISLYVLCNDGFI